MTQTLTVSRAYAFPPERVFDAWLDPGRAGKFLFATDAGEVVRCEIDPRQGGRFVIVDRRPDHGDVFHEGQYVEIDRPRRLAFDFWVDQDPSNKTRITLDFRATDGGCEVTLTHESVPDEFVERTNDGWTMILANLERAI